MLNDAGIVVNVTTRHNMRGVSRWERQDKYPHINKFGVSIGSAKMIDRHADVCYHVVLGTLPMSEVYNILMKAPSVLLLDFKTTGRGASGPTHDYSNWLEVARAVVHNRRQTREEWDDSNWQVGIDTPLAKRFATELEEIGIPEVLFETEEGKHSAYWDLVKGEFGPCSYDPDRMVQVPKQADAQWFRDTFLRW
jgi:hypothetical protein